MTKRGKPVAVLTPIRPNPRESIGSLPDIIVDPEDDLLSTGMAWAAELREDPAERANFITARMAVARRRSR